MKFILAKKVAMTRLFTEDGLARAGTILSVEPVVVTQVKMADGKDKYSAVQVATGVKKTKNISKAVLGHTKGKGYSAIREFRTPDSSFQTPEVGSSIDASTFQIGDVVQVSGITKGHGFQGGVKRHGFHGGSRTHGQKHSEREPGSIGGGPGRAGGRVAPGMRMAGHMGVTSVTVKNLKVLMVDAKAGEIIVSGAVPGARGTLLEVVGGKQ